MPGTTSNYGLRYPGGGDAVNVAVDVQNLADDVDGALDTLAPRIWQFRRSAAGPSIPDSTPTTITGFDTTLIGVGPTLTVSGGQITVSKGIWEVRYFVTWPAISAAHRTVLTLLKNSAAIYGGLDTKWYPSGTTAVTQHGVTGLVQCDDGDVLGHTCYQSSGSAQTLDNTFGPVFGVRRITAATS